MSTRRSVVISGDLGSGKSTVSLLLAERLGMRRISMGELYRSMAQERGMSALQLNLLAERNEEIDDQIDQMQAEMARSGELLIIDSRLAWFFFADAFKIHLIVDPLVAAQRVMARPASEVEAYSSMTEAVERLQSRSDSERTRFLHKYGVDKAKLRNYDIVCDTTRARPEELVAGMVDAYHGRLFPDVLRQPPLLLLDPARIYPSHDIGPQAIASPASRAEPSSAGPGGPPARAVAEPISIAYTGRYFYVVDGHQRLSRAVADGRALVAARLIAEGDEEVAGGLSAQQYFEAEASAAAVAHWAAAHQVILPLPEHLQVPSRVTEKAKRLASCP